MKFGKLMRATVETRMPTWRDHCINYKQLKRAKLMLRAHPIYSIKHYLTMMMKE